MSWFSNGMCYNHLFWHCLSKPLHVKSNTTEIKGNKKTVKIREGREVTFFTLNEMQSLDAVSSFDKVAAQCRRGLSPNTVNSAIMSL